MKNKTGRRLGIGLLCASMIVSAIGGMDHIEGKAKPKLNKSDITLELGQKFTLKVKGYTGKLKWSSSDLFVCSVNKKGVVKAADLGNAIIKVKAGKKTLKCKVVVKKKKVVVTATSEPGKKDDPKNTVSITGLTLNGDIDVLAPGASTTLTVGYKPEKAKASAVDWYTTDKSVLTVDENGKVKAVGAGTAKIVAKLKSNTKIAAGYSMKVADVALTESVAGSHGGDILLSDGTAAAICTFKLSENMKNVKATVYNALDQAIKTIEVGTVVANTDTQVVWDLTDSNGARVTEGNYRFKFSVAGTTKEGSYFGIYNKVEFSGGNGSESSPYLISNVEDFKKISEHNGAYYKQTADLDFQLAGMTPLFTADVPFTGTYDGAGFRISNISNVLDTSDNVAVFTALGESGVIKNLTISNCIITGKANVAALVGRCMGTLDNCKIESCVLLAKNGDVGALCGVSSNGKVLNCSTTGNTISAKSTAADGKRNAGGLVGVNSGTISTCSANNNNVTVSDTTHGRAGGIAGLNMGNIVGAEVNATNLTAIGAVNCYAGGIAGMNTSTIVSCKTAEVKGEATGAYGTIVGAEKGTSQMNTSDGNGNQAGSTSEDIE